MKPKVTRPGNNRQGGTYDRCQTPPYAIAPLLPYLKQFKLIWEPASGDGILADEMLHAGLSVIASDLTYGPAYNFFDFEPRPTVAFSDWEVVYYDCIVTNPPYSIKPEWLARCRDLGKPYALLMPVEAHGAAGCQEILRGAYHEIIYLNHRANFKMPNAGWLGSSAQFPVCWFTYGLNIGGPQNTYANIDREFEQWKRYLKALKNQALLPWQEWRNL